MATIRQRGKSWRVETYHHGTRASKTFKSEAVAKAWVEQNEGRFVGIKTQQRLIQDHRIVGYMPERLKAAVAKANYSRDEILSCSMPAANMCGVYFLIAKGSIKYVGQTINLFHRLAQHKRAGKKFDSYSFIPCEQEQLNELERIYCDLLMPDENKY